MPGSCDSDRNSSANLITSLRQFRFQSKQTYQPGNNTSSSAVQKSSNTSGKSILPRTPVIKSEKFVTESPNTLNQNSNSASHLLYSPLSYRKYGVPNDTFSIVHRLKIKIRQIIKQKGVNHLVSELKLSLEELKKLKEIILQHSSTTEKWSSHVTEDSTETNNKEKVLKVNYQYLKEILQCLNEVYNNNLINNSARQIAVNKPAITYSRNIKKTSTTTRKEILGQNNCTLNATVENRSLNQASEIHKQLAMDDYEVFCEKEQNLRKLLDAFPGADIMEAQDILVRCQWDLQKAMVVAQQKPLRTTRKRSFSSTFLPQPSTAGNSQGEVTSGNSNNNPGDQSNPTTSKVMDEIVLDSSDEEANGVFSSAQSKRTRRVISSDSEDERELQRQEKSKRAPAQPNNNNTTNVLSSQKIAVAITVPATVNSSNSGNVTVTAAETISVPSSVSIRAVPSSISNTEQVKNVPVSNTIPNLPKGLVITQVHSNDSSSTNKVVADKKSSDILLNGKTKNGSASISVVSNKTEQGDIASHNIVNTNKSLHLVRIKPSNNSVSITPTDNTKSSSPAVSTGIPASISKSVSITPISKSLSITPVATSAQKRSTVSNSKHSAGNSVTISQKKSDRPKNSRSKHRDSTDEDDEEYGNEDIYDSDDSECEENLTSAHSAVLKFFQEATAEELGLIPGCSKKKIEAVMNARPFNKWIDLVDKLKNDKTLSTDLLNGGKKVLDMRNAITRLMTKCQQISLDMEDLVENLKENKESSTGYVSKQPDLLNDRVHLTSYQMLGLNWLLILHNQEVNGILADEMGLGKTVQAIAFLAYLKEISISGPHLIVVPSSTLDNWKKELETWWPSVSLICYHGLQESRRELRMQILNDEVDEFDVMITTYNMVTSSAEDRSFFKRLEFHYVVFDEAHMLKNMASQRYQSLMRIRAPRRLLLTGTPLQNNLVELMSLLIFAMPHMFSGKIEQVKQMFSCVSKADGNKNSYEKDRIDHAKRIMKPFVLRRLKREVLKELPAKHEETRSCCMTEDQAEKYKELVTTFSAEVENTEEKEGSSSGAGMMMQLRRAANHPLLLRRHYDDDKLLQMSKLMLNEPTHSQSDPNMVFEDMCVMHDFELHKLCKSYSAIKPFALSKETILNSGKFRVLDSLLPDLFKEDHRILLFSQFTMVLDIIEEYMDIKGYKYLRLDGQVPVQERQLLIDEFNNNPDINVFLLSTRAGGLGINLTAADTVILHDIDFNPYNDKQAEDRCHRVGQVRDVRVVRLISEDTIEEGILQRAKEKLKLERDIHEENDTEENDMVSVARLLRDALGLKSAKS